MARIHIMILIVSAFFLIGCAPKIDCVPPNVLLGNKCCLDLDEDNSCDSSLQVSAEKQDLVMTASPEEDFAERFAELWGKEQYLKMHGMLDLTISAEEFVFLAERQGVEDVKLLGVDESSAAYSFVQGDVKRTVSVDILEEKGKHYHPEFGIFSSLTYESVCRDDQCSYEFALLKESPVFCDDAGDLRVRCREEFGLAKSYGEWLEECSTETDYRVQEECINSISVAYDTIEPCKVAIYDRQRYACYGVVAAAREDVGFCTEFFKGTTLTNNNRFHGLCVFGYARETGDLSVCSEMVIDDDHFVADLFENCEDLT